MISSQIKRLVLVGLISSACALSASCGTQRPEPQSPVADIPADNSAVNDELDNQQTQQDENDITKNENKPDADITETDEDNEPIVISVPNEADGIKLLQYENITFKADTTPMPDISATVSSARKNKDASSMFITHMMYRDNIGDIAYYNNGKKQENELSEKELHREMIRWRDAAFEANYELAILATAPSVQYEVSPFFSDDAEFKKGMNWLKDAAARGYGNAEYVLGLVYFNGVGINRNKEKGFELLVRAAAHGVINAYYAVAMIYELGLNGKADTQKSLYWLNKAAHFGSKDAAFILSMKYLDGIDVPKDKTKALKTIKLDPKYHAWIKLIDEGFYHKFCIYRFDESAIGWSAEEYGVCGDDVEIVHKNNAGIDEDKEDYTLDEIAESCLNYRIDYRVAANWLKNVATFDRDNAYILRAKTHHITGCRGGLDGDNYGEIILYPQGLNEEDFYKGDNYDDFPVLFKKLIIAISDYHEDSSKLIKKLEDMALTGDRESLKMLGGLYEHDSDLKYIYEPLKINLNNLKAFEYYEKLFNIDEAACKNAQEDKCQLAAGNVVYVARKLAKEYDEKGDYNAAYEWYEKAYKFGVRARDNEYAIILAQDLAEVSYKNRNYDVEKQWHQKTIELYMAQYDALKNKNDKDSVNKMTNIASELGMLYHKLGDDKQALEWYNKALKFSDKYKSMISYYYSIEMEGKRHDDIMFNLAGIYDAESSSIYDRSKAVNLYQNILINKRASSKHQYQAAIRLCEISYQHSQQSDKLLAVAYCKIASELYHEEESNVMGRSEIMNSNDKEIQLFQRVIEELPKLDLLKEIEEQIKAEKDKDPEKFYVISKVLGPCEQEAEDDPEGGPQCSLFESAYSESRDKAITAITALNLASGSLNIDIIENTYYYLAIYKGRDAHYRNTLRKESAVYNSFFEGEHSWYYSYMNDSDQDDLFYIWYFRQIPHAAAEKFKELKTSKSWNEYTKEAKKVVEENRLPIIFYGDRMLEHLLYRSKNN